MENCSDTGHIINLTMYGYSGKGVTYKTFDTVNCVIFSMIGIVMVGTIFGNVSVIISAASSKFLKNGVNIYVVNLAVADLLICFICMTSFLAKNLVESGYILGKPMCKVGTFAKVTCLISSVVTLSAIAGNRLLSVLYPIRNLTTKQRKGLFIFAIWLFSAFVSLPVLVYKKYTEYVLSNITLPQCRDNWPQVYNVEERKCESSQLKNAYYTIVSVVLFFLPVTILSVTFPLMLRQVSKSLPGEKNQTTTNVCTRNRKGLLRLAITVIFFFVICWMPFQILMLYELYATPGITLPEWFHRLYSFSEFLAYFNSFCNPIIYGFFNKNFRDSLCLVLRCRAGGREGGRSEFFERIRLTLPSSFRPQGAPQRGCEEEVKRNKEAIIDPPV